MDSTLSAQPLKRSLPAMLLQAVFPETCLLCQNRLTSGALICEPCAAAHPIERAPMLAPQRYERRFGFVYAGSGKALLKAAKFGNRRRALAEWIQLARPHLAELVRQDTQLLVLPSSKPFLLRLLRKAVPADKLITNAFRLRRRRLFEREANKFLSEAARYRRIHDTLEWNHNVNAGAARYIICDDISTTGATLNRAAQLAEQHLQLSPDQICLWALLYRPREFTIS